MEASKKRKTKDVVEKKELVRTNFGPEEDPQTYQAYRNM
jgi:hypothetical protein